ncbi:hypothetical protein Bca101_041105 [Brassica carinata]
MGRKKSSHVHSAPCDDDDTMYSRESKPKRIYQLWPGNNKFYCGGRLVFGPDASSLLLTTAMIGAPAVTFSIRMAFMIGKRYPFFHSLVLMGSLLLTVLDFTFLFLTSSRDPGIIPRNKDAPEGEGLDKITQSSEWLSSVIPVCFTVLLAPLTAPSAITVSKDLIITVHGWANASLYILEPHGKMLLMVITDDAIFIVLIVYCFVVVWFVGGLTTTYENFRYRYDKKENPYGKGLFKNLYELFFARIPPPMINFRDWAPEEPDVEVGSIASELDRAFGPRGDHKHDMGMEIGDWKTSKGGLLLQTVEYDNKNHNIEETVKKKDVTAETNTAFDVRSR